VGSTFKRTRVKNGKRFKEDKYTIKYRLADGTWWTETAYADKQASKALLVERERAVSRGEQHFVDEFKEHRKMALRDHLTAFKASVRAGGATDKYVKRLETRLTYAFECMKAERAAGLTMERAERFVLRLRDEKRALATVNHYVSALKEFSRWGFARGRWPKDALAGLKRVNAEADLRRRRRAITPKEFGMLVAAARTRAVDEYVRTHPPAPEEKLAELRHNGESRAIACQLAGLAGLRYNEVKTLCWGDVDFDKAPARITIRAKNAKSKREDTIPISDALATALMRWFDAEKARLGRSPAPDERVVHVGSRFRESFKKDHESVKIKRQDASERYFDFHALRHSFASWLAQAGTHPKVAQELLRHTDIRLTLKHYTHTTPEQQASALAALPTLENGAPNSTTDSTTDSTTAMADEAETCVDVSSEGKTADRPADGECVGECGHEKGADDERQPQSQWWRRGESNPRPVTARQEPLRA